MMTDIYKGYDAILQQQNAVGVFAPPKRGQQTGKDKA